GRMGAPRGGAWRLRREARGLAVPALGRRGYRYDGDRRGDEERAPRVGAREDEAAERPLEAYLVAGLEAAEPLRADPCGRDVGAEREHLGGLRGRGDRVGADGLRAERDRHPLAGVGLEGRRVL